jgi:multimeric flavodoxin WrbA
VNVMILNDHCARNTTELNLLKGLCDGILAPHEIQWVDAHELEVQPCQKCEKCHPFGECVLTEDDAHRFGRLLFATDALVVGLSGDTPNLTATCHALLERCRSALAYMDRNGDIRPWRKNRPAAVATLGGATPARPSSDGEPLPSALSNILNAGGFQLVGMVQESAEQDPTVIEQAQNLGRVLSERMYFTV